MKKIVQLNLTLTTPPKKKRNKLSPEIHKERKEKEHAHRIFKLLKSNKFTSFTEADKNLLRKYYPYIDIDTHLNNIKTTHQN